MLTRQYIGFLGLLIVVATLGLASALTGVTAPDLTPAASDPELVSTGLKSTVTAARMTN